MDAVTRNNRKKRESNKNMELIYMAKVGASEQDLVALTMKLPSDNRERGRVVDE